MTRGKPASKLKSREAAKETIRDFKIFHHNRRGAAIHKTIDLTALICHAEILSYSRVYAQRLYLSDKISLLISRHRFSVC